MFIDRFGTSLGTNIPKVPVRDLKLRIRMSINLLSCSGAESLSTM